LISHLLVFTCALFLSVHILFASDVLVEAEGFTDRGGWAVDQQFMDQMGSPFLLAHGMGIPVTDAVTTVTFPNTGVFHIYVRTRDWVAPAGPGAFRLLVDGHASDSLFGVGGDGSWQWEYGGTVAIGNIQTEIRLKDSTGFEGRCDAILFRETALLPPNDGVVLSDLRKSLLGLPAIPPDTGIYDLVVVGGGIAGISAAIAAARHGCSVALIQDRPVLGGNASSEVGVGTEGGIRRYPYPNLGSIVAEITMLGDAGKLNLVLNESNISLFMNTHAFQAEMDSSHIVAVYAKHIMSGREWRFPARVFADCSGDGTIGFLAGAEYMMGRESRAATGETGAPVTADSMCMGVTNRWYAVQETAASGFPVCPWALQFSEATYNNFLETTQNNWQWETGFYRNQITEGEYIRDCNFRAIYGNWSFLKNVKGLYPNWKLSFVGHISGKRESRRLIGDYVMTQQDLLNPTAFPDGCVGPTWPIDLHYPEPWNAALFPADPFISNCLQGNVSPTSAVPYRCFYSKNIDNLFMAGRCMSVTHMALGSVRVMRTLGMAGEVVGMAAHLCKTYSALPRDIYQSYFADLQTLMGPQAIDTTDTMNAIIIDNTEAQVNDSWTSSTSTWGYYGTDYLHDGNAGKGSKSVAYVPVLPATGQYDVFLVWTAGDNRATNVPVIVDHNGGADTITVNMRNDNGLWVKIGGFPFDSGSSGRVIISNSGTSGYVIADAVMFRPDSLITHIGQLASSSEGVGSLDLSPNPFNPAITIWYNLSAASNVKVEVFNSQGKLVTIVVNKNQNKGFYRCKWGAVNRPSGLYVFRLTAGKFRMSKKALLLK